MSTFLWYSRTSELTGKLLASALKLKEAEHGILPPREFNGTIISWGASPTSAFKWGDRKIISLLNDPRNTHKYADKETLYKVLAEAALPTMTHQRLTATTQIGAEKKLVVCSLTGSKARLVTSQEELNVAFTEGKQLVLDSTYLSSNKQRYIVMGGKVIATLIKKKFTPGLEETQRVIQNTLDVWDNPTNVSTEQAVALLDLMLSKDIIVPGTSGWAEDTRPVTAKAREDRAVKAIEVLGLDLGVVDIDVDSGKIINVNTTPALDQVPSVVGKVAQEILSWCKDHGMTAKEVIASMIADATDEEAEALLDELRAIKKGLTAA